MKNRDLVSGIFWLGFGALFAVGGLMQGLMRQGIPGPGSLPFIIGLICMGLSLVVVIQAVARRDGSAKKFFPERDSLRKLVLMTAGIIAYGLLLKKLGFTGTTFLFLIFVLGLIGREKWVTALSFSLLTAIVSYLLFTALQVDLPRGILGI